MTSSGTLHFGGGTPAPQDDVQVARFRDAGAIIVGTTVMTEFGVTPLGFNSHFNATYVDHFFLFSHGVVVAAVVYLVCCSTRLTPAMWLSACV